jgi:phage terminase small subunit
MMARPLTPKQQRFIEEYVVDLNATQAAIRAGYSAKTINKNVRRLMVNEGVAQAIQQQQAELAGRTRVTAERVILEYARLAFAEQRAFVEWGPDGVRLKPSDTLSTDDAAAVAEVSQTITDTGGSIRFKLHDKKGALDSLAKHLGLFREGIDLHTTVVVRLPDKAPSAQTWQATHQNGQAAAAGDAHAD